MRNYRKYWIAKEVFEFEFPPGTWNPSNTSWQNGRTEQELADLVANDLSFVVPPFRMTPEFLGPYYLLIDSDLLAQAAFRFLVGIGPFTTFWQGPPSPRKVWSNGK